MEYVPTGQSNTVLCCMCGMQITPNPSGMCVNCIRSQYDITEGIPKQLSLQWCKSCERFLQPPQHWVHCGLESRELLTVCLRKLRGVKSNVRLVDAGFVWTEPHSKIVKVKLSLQSEVFAGTILQQDIVVDFAIENLYCTTCHRVSAKDTWTSVVQVRQKADNKRTFFLLEQMLLKHSAHAEAMNIREVRDGMDFYFAQQQHAIRFVSFVEGVVPTKKQGSERLISMDQHTGKGKLKYTWSAEIAPNCKDDVVVLPPRLARSMGNAGPLMIVTRVGAGMQLVDPLTLLGGDLQCSAYWGTPFVSIATQKHMQEFTVLDVELLGPRNHKWALAEVECARTCDLGKNDDIFFTKTHLGNVLNPGDLCMGYNVQHLNFNEHDLKDSRRAQLPDVLLVKKTYRVKGRSARRKWKLKFLAKEEAELTAKAHETASTERDMETFMQTLEEDPELRTMVSMYRDPSKLAEPEEDMAAEGMGASAAEAARFEDEEDPDANLDVDEFDQLTVQVGELLLDSAEATEGGAGMGDAPTIWSSTASLQGGAAIGSATEGGGAGGDDSMVM